MGPKPCALIRGRTLACILLDSGTSKVKSLLVPKKVTLLVWQNIKTIKI